MPDRFRKYIVALDAVVYVFCLFGVYRVALKSDVPAEYIQSRSLLIVSRADSATGLSPGDTLRSVHGHQVTSEEDVEFITDGLAIGSILNFEVEKGGKRRSIDVLLIPYYTGEYIIIIFLAGTLHFLIAVFVLVRRFQDKAAHVFHWLMVCLVFIIMPTWGYHLTHPSWPGITLRILFSAGYAFLPIFFIHFTFIFPRIKLTSEWKRLNVLYFFSALLAVWMSIAFTFAVTNDTMSAFHRYMAAFDVCRIYFALGMVFSIGNFIHSYVTAVEESERRKLRWILISIVIVPLTYVGLWQIPMVVASYPLIKEEYMLILSLLIPFTFAVSISRYRLMNIDLIFNRSTVYFMVGGILLAVYTAIVGVVAVVAETFTVTASVATSGVAAVVVALLFQPAKERVQKFVDQKFFKVQYNFRAAQRKLVEEISRCPVAGQLGTLLADRIQELIPVESIAFILNGDHPGKFQLLAQSNYPLNEGRIETLKNGAIIRSAGLKEKIEPMANVETGHSERLKDLNCALLFPALSEKDAVLGFLLVGEKKSGLRFTLEDIDLLNAVSTQAGLSLERMALHERLILEHAETQRLEELNRLKSFFVSSVSHDLKTPLTSIKMFAEILGTKKNMSGKENGEFLNIITGEAERLTRLINNVLNFSRVERGVREYHFSKVDLNQLVRSVLDTMDYQFKMYHFKVNAQVGRKALAVEADADAIKDVIMNLISNAMKYSPVRKEISIRTDLVDNYYTVSVEDHGIGIGKDELGKIFEVFYRARNEATLKLGGLGLGLTLVKHTMNAHSGVVEVESSPGKGSRFTLLFPRGG